MIFIFLSILCSVIIGNLLLGFSKGKSVEFMQIFLGNYFLAAIFSYTQLESKTLSVGTFEILFGILTGFFFLFNFIAYQKSIHTNGLSLSVGIMRVAVVIPTFMSVLVFSDAINFFNLFGVVTIVFAFIFITETKTYHNLIWLIILFLVSGMTDSTLKIYSELGKPDNTPFVLILFSAAFFFTLFAVIVSRRKFSWRFFGFGLVLGIPNQLSTVFFLAGLKSVPATVAYPVTASSIVVFSILSDILIWRRMFTVKQRLALALLVAGIALVNIR
jgi:drug/metabolite transporter (DMT)-like permease